ncbi:hypothetical protein CDD80_2251 [Ophiocordyceps camponoti-rufipedis]|uniref:DNA (cytosine-5-)-methyltransferase n=1 Tax=Ophiocordyceps camponoti-rufipedis TaxID=2004952 RepID=A0A2C5Z713_9HYPO|nr:hypothetical protein CDD80_2251 [Ophiocordyceps camponoti-rufipedis]
MQVQNGWLIEHDALVGSDLVSQDSSTKASERPSKNKTCRPICVEIPASTLMTPRAYFEPFESDVPVMPEPQALAMLAMATQREAKGDFIEYDLDDFAVYRDAPPKYPRAMRSLHHLDQAGKHYFCGILSIGGKHKVMVEHVLIEAMPIGNYGDRSKHTVRGHIWLRSDLNRRCETYYRLGTPAKEYARFFEPSLWVLDLGKHFVDFLKVSREHARRVDLHLFRSTFSTWLVRTHGQAPVFVEWFQQHPRADFRTSISANIAYLRKEAIGVLGERATYFHPIWSEVFDFRRYKQQPTAADSRTVVTQYIYDCFEEMLFADQLVVVPISAKTESLRNRLIRERHLELPSALDACAVSLPNATDDEQTQNIRPGDTISTRRDGELSGSKWKREIPRGFDDVDRWFALVQKVQVGRDGVLFFDVIWYYRPVDTLCGLMKYPWNNELFLSDHCSCDEARKIRADQVLGVHEVDFGGTSTTTSEFFCRQTYISEERKWISLTPEHRWCEHVVYRSLESPYQAGDTLLVLQKPRDSFSEPCEVVSVEMEEKRVLYRLRKLLRRQRLEPQARPNELVYTNFLFQCGENSIVGRCHVRYFPANSEISTPYDRDGVGAFFFMTHQEVVDELGRSSLVELESAPPSLRQGFDPAVEIPRLRGFDLFCGGGNFGRGLEEGGGIRMNWANDYDKQAIHTYMANVQPEDTVTPFLGSINDLQRRIILGNFSSAVPAIGKVDFVSGGSPCPGFSRLTNDKTCEKQRKNQSLVASFGSFIDLYRPRYGLLENVPGIVHGSLHRDQDAFSQLVCAVVGLGYQVELFFLDASSCGSSQRRSRVFLALAAPGCRLPAKPAMTHAHPPGTRALKIGKLPNNESMAKREMPRATPFDFVSAADATADLPAIYDAKPDTCVAFPDHRVSTARTHQQRLRISLIPKQPYGMNFALLQQSRVMTKTERNYFSSVKFNTLVRANGKPGGITCHSYGRQMPGRLMETIVTTPNPCDGKNGRTLHWSEDRVISVMEARRSQGFRDDEVVLGMPPNQFKIVGNSVAREVALAFGIVFREAWEESLRTSGGMFKVQTEEWSESESSSATTTTTGSKRRSKLVVEIPVKRRRRSPSPASV